MDSHRGTCLDENDLAASAGGGMSPLERGSADDHLRTCGRCREEIALLLNPTGGRPERPGAPAQLPSRGSTVGRYVVEALVGAGAMGAVFRVRDPLLERTVALKFLAELWSGEHGSAGVARLAAEAQTLARLNDPNVVALYDVGEWNGQLFLAMEWLDGGSLHEWLDQPRGWREVVDVFCKAGRGLASAHAAGLIHRDFKPHNVLLGAGGRVRVADFGLASSRSGSGGHGTPGYMAPEQADGSAEPRSDQFAFCVALAEALGERRPGPDARAPTHDRLGRRLPRTLRQALTRGLASSPEQRYPDMNALLARLERLNPATAWRLTAVAAAACVVALGVGLRAHQERLCGASDPALAKAWSADTRGRLRAAFLRTGLPFAEDVFHRVTAGLDDYASAWNVAHAEACLARRVRRSVPEETYALQTACLERARAGFVALVPVLLDPDNTVVASAQQAVAALPGVVNCTDTHALLLQRWRESGPSSAAGAVAAQVARAEALQLAGRAAPALALAKEAVAAARRLNSPVLLAQALFHQGALEGHLHDVPAAGQSLQEATWLALESRDDLLGAQAAVALADTYVSAMDRQKELALWVPFAQALLKRLPSDSGLDAKLEYIQGRATWFAGHEREAVPLLERAGSLAKDGFQRTRNAAQAVVAVNALSDEGNVLAMLGELDRAERQAQAAIALAEEVFGPQHPLTSQALSTEAFILTERGQPELAIPLRWRDLHLLEALLGREHPSVGAGLADLGVTLVAAGRPKEASDLQERAFHIMETKLGPASPITLMVLSRWAWISLEAGNLASAKSLAERAWTGFQRLQEPRPERAESLEVLGRVELQRGRSRAAASLLGRALEVPGAEPLPRVHFRFAEALWRLGSRPKAVSEARRALDEAKGPKWKPLRTQVSTWLEDRGYAG